VDRRRQLPDGAQRRSTPCGTTTTTSGSAALQAARSEQGTGDLAEHEIPASVTLFSAVVTKENVDSYLPLASE
jgi:hypothetical protein